MTPLPIGISTFVWHSPLTTPDLQRLVPKLGAWGFEAIEMPLEHVGDWDPAVAADLLSGAGLASVVGGVMAPGRELTAAGDDVIRSTQDYLRACVDVAARQGAHAVVGPLYTSVGRTWRLAAGERSGVIARLRTALAEVADYASERGVVLGVEPLNRYETSLVNTVEQALEVVDGIPGAGLTLDTYHMNIEERSFADAFAAAGDRIVHLQVCGNDRGAPGGDLLPWDGIREAIERSGYRGMLAIESFTADNESISTAASIWRPLASTQDALATDGLTFLRDWRPS